MKKLSLFTLISIGLITTSASAVTYTIGDVFNGISKVVSSVTAPSDGSSSSVSPSAPVGVLVKDLPDLPKLTDKPFLRGLSKIDYAELQRDSGSKNDARMIMRALDGRQMLGNFANKFNSQRQLAINFQDDASNVKKFDRSGELTGFSNPYASDTKAFELSKLDDATRTNSNSVYTYTIKTHFKIPDEFVSNGKFVFEADNPGVQTYIRGRVNSENGKEGFSQICFHRINNEFLKGKKNTYAVKKGNIVDYDMTCYFSGNNEKRYPDSLRSIKESNEALSKSWTVYKIPDPLAKDAGKSYTLTNRDMFLYENEVYPAK